MWEDSEEQRPPGWSWECGPGPWAGDLGVLEEGLQSPGGHSTPAPGPGLQAVVLCCSYARCHHWRKLGEGDVGFFCIFAFYLHANLQVSKNKKLKTQIAGVSPSPDSWPLSHVAIVW